MAMKFRKQGLNCSMMDWKGGREKTALLVSQKAEKIPIQTLIWARMTERHSLLGHEHTHSQMSQPGARGVQQGFVSSSWKGLGRWRTSHWEGLCVLVLWCLCLWMRGSCLYSNRPWFWLLTPLLSAVDLDPSLFPSVSLTLSELRLTVPANCFL